MIKAQSDQTQATSTSDVTACALKINKSIKKKKGKSAAKQITWFHITSWCVQMLKSQTHKAWDSSCFLHWVAVGGLSPLTFIYIRLCCHLVDESHVPGSIRQTTKY